MEHAPLLIVDDDSDDREFLQDAWKDLDFPNALVFFNNGEEVLRYLRYEKVSPFLILCDVNLPRMDGFELKKKILEDTEMNYKSIPFVFWSSQASKAQIQKAYDLGGNGFFVKANTFEETKQSLINIVGYWRKSKTPY
jgi:CheY-like chemotaxis protein